MSFPPADLRQFMRCLTGGTWKSGLFRAGVLAVVIVAGALLVAWSGLVSVAASSGHAKITYLFLDFAKRNAVETQSAGVTVPPLDDPALIMKGAGHYATGCAPCHGAPGHNRAVVSIQMTPTPPLYSEKFSRWDAAEKFWIVKHGIKYTGMPAWPALEREDEMWAMVSFLQRLPEMTPEEYDHLAYGPAFHWTEEEIPPVELRALADDLSPALTDCARCHGFDGMGRGSGAFPRLAGQNETYLFASLQAFADGERHSGVMQAAAANIDEQTLHALAEYYADLPATNSASTVSNDNTPLARGSLIAAAGIPERGIPACQQCHGPGGARNPMYPELAGQYAEYLVLQLELFKTGKRGGTPYAHIMTTVTRRMTPQDMHAVALYYASLPPPENSNARK
ncbi:MAG TPA: c-type cytochrome [Gammaproteobacteria bacterium]